MLVARSVDRFGRRVRERVSSTVSGNVGSLKDSIGGLPTFVSYLSASGESFYYESVKFLIQIFQDPHFLVSIATVGLCALSNSRFSA